jgi:hypothetical protein
MEGKLPGARRESWVQNGQGHAVPGSRHVSMLSASGEYDGHIPRAQDTYGQTSGPLGSDDMQTGQTASCPHRCRGRPQAPDALVTLSLLCCSSVPGTKKGNPLLLKIHFKLSSPQPQRND